MPFDIDTTTPGDSDIVSQFPANERTNRETIEDWLAEEHDTAGHHKIPIDTTTNRDGVADWSNGSLFWNTTTGAFQIRVGGAWKQVGFGAGVSTVFYDAAAPLGWTQDVGVNDKVLKVVSGAGGGSSGSWTISGIAVANHTLTIAQMPAHTHQPDDNQRDFVVNTGGFPNAASGAGGDMLGNPGADAATGSTGGGGGHNHDLTFDGLWRPACYEVIMCNKD